MGTIVIAPKITWCLADYVENLIHEMSHIDLFIRQLIDPIVEKNVLLNSPLRKNKRPTIGVFHAAFVLSRVVKLLAALLNDQCETELTRVRLLNNYQNLILNEMNLSWLHYRSLTTVGIQRWYIFKQPK